MTLTRLWGRIAVSPRGCWEWTGSVDPQGYGRIGYNGSNQHAHRVAWLVLNGPILDGLLVCHHCDNRRCINPAHLFLGTNADNIRDAAAKGRLRGRRHVRGDEHPRRRLSSATVAELRALYEKGGVSFERLAKVYGVSYTAVRLAIRGKTWSHV